MLSTAVTVPQVVFTTLPATGGATAAAVGLAPASVVSIATAAAGIPAPAAGTPVPVYGTSAAAVGISASASAAVSDAAVVPAVASSISTGFGTTYIPTSTSTGGPLQVTTNAGIKVGGSVVGLFAGAFVAVMAL